MSESGLALSGRAVGVVTAYVDTAEMLRQSYALHPAHTVALASAMIRVVSWSAHAATGDWLGYAKEVRALVPFKQEPGMGVLRYALSDESRRSLLGRPAAQLLAMTYSNPLRIRLGVLDLQTTGTWLSKVVHPVLWFRATGAELRYAAARSDSDRILKHLEVLSTGLAIPGVTFEQAAHLRKSYPELAPFIDGGDAADLAERRRELSASLEQVWPQVEQRSIERATNDVQLIASMQVVAEAGATFTLTSEDWTPPR